MKTDELNDISLKVTRIKNRWHVRAYILEAVVFEMACNLKQDINWTCREVVVWVDKLGMGNAFTTAVRKRQRGSPNGRIWRRRQLQDEQTARAIELW